MPKAPSYLKCPSCGAYDGHVIETQPISIGVGLRRRRECLACRDRWTTQERRVEDIDEGTDEQLQRALSALDGVVARIVQLLREESA